MVDQQLTDRPDEKHYFCCSASVVVSDGACDEGRQLGGDVAKNLGTLKVT